MLLKPSVLTSKYYNLKSSIRETNSSMLLVSLIEDFNKPRITLLFGFC